MKIPKLRKNAKRLTVKQTKKHLENGKIIFADNIEFLNCFYKLRSNDLYYYCEHENIWFKSEYNLKQLLDFSKFKETIFFKV